MNNKTFSILFVVLWSIMCSHAQVEQKNTVFISGDKNVNSYRIPSIITAKDGSLIVFAEARHVSWRDKSRTDIVMKRSTDNGKTWTSMKNLTNGETGAYMDPTAVMEKKTGKIFLFTSFWPADNHSGKATRAFLLFSEDNGITWSKPYDVTAKIFPENIIPQGFGPGNGIQMQGCRYKHRLIIPIRATFSSIGTKVGAIYSDDFGKNWTIGSPGDSNDELQIAETPYNTLIYNARFPGKRMIAHSYDGGNTWTKALKDDSLPAASKGCHSSLLANKRVLYFCGIKGIHESSEFDERGKLMLYKSNDNGKTWNNGVLLYEKAAGYSCMSFLRNGKIAIVFETADTNSFTRSSIENTNPPQRPAGWMRLDVMIINPKEL